jgi:hypothetical protein
MNKQVGFDLDLRGQPARMAEALGVAANVLSNWRKQPPDPAGCRNLTHFWRQRAIDVTEEDVFRAAGHLSPRRGSGANKLPPPARPLPPEIERLLEALPRLSPAKQQHLLRAVGLNVDLVDESKAG